LTTTITISQTPSLYDLPPLATERYPQALNFPSQVSDPHFQYEALSPISELNGAVTKAYSFSLIVASDRFVPSEDSRSTPPPDGGVIIQSDCTVASTADSGPVSLRACLESAQIGDAIDFDPGVFPPTSPATITLLSALPLVITDDLTIDAINAGVILDGSGLSDTAGLFIGGASGVKIQGLQITACPLDAIALAFGASGNTIASNRIYGNGRAGIWLQNADTVDNVIQGNLIGTDGSGTTAIGNLGDGIFIGYDASDNIIGGVAPDAGNLISGNGDDGIQLQGPGTTRNQILGNKIGTDLSGTLPLGNLDKGIVVILGSSDNIIGGTAPGAGNLVSGNRGSGIWFEGNGTTGNTVNGNLIGTDVSGTVALGNLDTGIVLLSGPSDNIIGGTTPGAGNLVSGNEGVGILLDDIGTNANQIQGNYIGTDVSGTEALGNLLSGIVIDFGASNNVIGGTEPGAGNLISGNDYSGIHIQNSGTTGNQILGNFIGTDISGTMALGNLSMGLFIGFGASENIVGGSTSEARNLVSGNEGSGIRIESSGTTNNTIEGNFVGTDVSGTVDIGNWQYGIIIYLGASSNRVGGTAPGEGNLVSGNHRCGIWLESEGTSSNNVWGNLVGTDADGATDVGNREVGIAIGFGASNNIVGGVTPGARNLVSGNRNAGIWLGQPGTIDNQVLGNFIGTNIDGTTALGNALAGVFIGFGASNNVIGGESPGAGNLISDNQDNGILLWGTDTTGNQIQGNLIGTDRHGTASLGNYPNGVVIMGGASNNLVGGQTVSAGNTIAFNGGDGVGVSDSQSLGNTISHNSIYNNEGLGIETINGGNTELAPPTISEVISTTVFGQAQPGNIVELFTDGVDEGRWFENSVEADTDGFFTLTYSGLNDRYLTATATDADGNTSEFSDPVPAVVSGKKPIFLPFILKNSG
jgi:titin